MEQMRPAVFPFVAQYHPRHLTSFSLERFRFPIQAACFPAQCGGGPAFQANPMATISSQPLPAHLSHQLANAAAAAVALSNQQQHQQQQHQHMQQQHMQQQHPSFRYPGPHPAYPQHHQALQPFMHPRFTFNQEDLDLVLYGYAKNQPAAVGSSAMSPSPGLCQSNNKNIVSNSTNTGSSYTIPGHALSGLRIGELSHGIERILSAAASCCSAASSSGSGSDSAASSPVKPISNSASNMAPPEPIRTDLPEGLAIYQTAFGGAVHYGIFCTKTVIAKCTRFGPFKGRVVNTSEVKTNDDNSLMWEIFRDGKLSHFIDGRGSAANWLAHINCARYAQEQNLIAIQTEGEIVYEVCKDIPQGTELLVWYGDCYLQFMGVPVALKEMADGGAQEEADTSEGYECDRCGKVFAYKYYRDKHLKYTRCVDQGDRKYPCHLCTRSFEKRDRLRIHILHVHEKHRPHKCLVCGKSFSQSSSLNKHMRVHSGERPYKCVYCNKAFTASSILRTHIRQHSGEKPFKCKHCGKAFASHAAHDSHVRRTHAKGKMSSCRVCGKMFSQPYELKFHMNTHPGE